MPRTRTQARATAGNKPTAEKKEPKSKAEKVILDVNHFDGCPSADDSRIETYEVLGPNGYVVISRCMTCGGHAGAKATPEPRL